MLIKTGNRPIAVLIAIAWAAALVFAFHAQLATAETPGPPAPLTFDATGAQVGEQLPNSPVYDLDGKPARLRDVWSYRGALLLTSSLTCPKSRNSYPRAEELATKLGDNLPVAIIYVLEAHPKGDPSPYRGYEDITAENRRDGILCRQPTSLTERLKLANQFKDRLHVKASIHVDAMDNALWSALGGGPNMGVLVDDQGLVIARQGWFDADSMDKAVDHFLAAAKANRKGDRQSSKDVALQARLKAIGIQDYEIPRVFQGQDVNAASNLLKWYPELINYTTGMGQMTHRETMLDFAIMGGSRAMVELLLSQGADIHAQNSSTPSPLYLAAKQGDAEIVALLVKGGANVNLRAPAGPMPLQEAAIYGHKTIVAALLKAGAKPNLYFDAANGDVDSVRQALESDPTRGIRPDGWNRTPLDYAAATGQLPVMKLLYSYGVKDNEPAVEFVSDPAIHWAANQKQTASVEFLLDSGDDPNTKGIWGESLLHIAADRNDTELAKVVLRYKPNLQIHGMDGGAPLHDAVRIQSYDVAALLLATGADPNVPFGPDRRPCGPFGADERGTLETPLQVAAEASDLRMLHLLLSHGAAINAHDRGGMTALHYAVSGGGEQSPKERIDAVIFLLANGADINTKNAIGRTPLDDTNLPELATILKKHGAKSGIAPEAQ